VLPLALAEPEALNAAIAALLASCGDGAAQVGGRVCGGGAGRGLLLCM
jgi:hypothetical protein